MFIDENVYVNCPYDDDFKPMLNAIIFATIFFGKKPIFCENTTSGTHRIEHIASVIRTSKFSIHDLSRFKSLAKGDDFIPKFNMPFELGMDMGFLHFSGSEDRKQMLVCLNHKDDLNKVLSDLGGHDVIGHDGNPELIIYAIREWLIKFDVNLTPASIVNDWYIDFELDYINTHLNKRRNPTDVSRLTKIEIIHDIKEWITERKGKFAKS